MAERMRYLLLLTLAAASWFLVLADFTIADLIAPDLQTSFHPPDPGEPVEAAAVGWRQRAVHEGQQNQREGRGASQGG